MYDVFVVGAGPAGCQFTQKIKGCNYKLIEEHGEVGRPVQCAGLVGENIFGYVEKEYMHKVNGAYIHYNNDSFSLRRDGVAYVIDREQFDKNLGKDLEISFNERFLAAERKNDAVEIRTNKGVYHSRYLVGSDGAVSKVRKYVTQKKPRYLKSVQHTIECTHDKNMISFFLKPFSWIIPQGRRECRVGVISEHPADDLPLLKGKVIKKTGGLIPIGSIQTYRNNIFLIGDAAAQVKPLTGGGLYYGIKAADIAGDLFLEGQIDKYDAEWKREFGKQIRFGLLGRGIYEHISGKDMVRFYNFVKENRSKIERSCEFDRHTSMLKIILSSPKIWPLFMKYLFKVLL